MIDRQITRMLIAMIVLTGLVACSRSSSPSQVTGELSAVGEEVKGETGQHATLGGGSNNAASASYATVCGGSYNTAGVGYSTVGGGFRNTAYGTGATVGGGRLNTATGRLDATVGGGSGNKAIGGRHPTVSGGLDNTASSYGATVGGGSYNTASGTHATIGGGVGNHASGFEATVAGGIGNTTSAADATIGGGASNQAGGMYATVGGGYGNITDGFYSVIPGGFRNEAAGDYSFAAGHRAQVAPDHNGSFLYADSRDFDFRSAAADEFAVRATGGVRWVTAIDESGNPIGGVVLAPGSGSWSSFSDRKLKTNVLPVDEGQILLLLAEMPISSWSYAGQDSSIRHIGPMAQDFHATFGVGEDDEHISTVDADGVALAAIQGLYELVQEQEAQIAALKIRVATLEQACTTGDSSARPPIDWLLIGGICLASVVLGYIQCYLNKRRML